MKDKFLENAKKYIKQGNCEDINCINCPASKRNSGTFRCGDLKNIEWFKNYIKENEVKQMTPIFENDRKFEDFAIEFRESNTIGDCKKICEKYGITIKKSIVDEAIEMYKEYCLADKNDLLHGTMYEAIQYLLKKYHTEFEK
jgi:hypothetical protein